MDRREFCQKATLVGGSAALAAILPACSRAAEPEAAPPPHAATQPAAALGPSTVAQVPTAPPTPTSHPTATEPLPTATEPAADVLTESTAVPPGPTAASPMAAVALVKTTDRAAGIRTAINLLGANDFRDRRVLLKPNYNSADPAPGSTHPDTLRALLQALQESGAAGITIGERSGMGATRSVMEQLGVLDLAAAGGADVVIFDELEPADWTIIQPEGSHWSAGFPLPTRLLEADCVVQTCNLKTHQYGGHFTLSLKNSVGFVARTVGPGGHNYMSELHDSPFQRHMIAEINSAYQPDLIVLDGVQAFVDGGPARGTIAQGELILASRDRVAIDAVGVAVLRLLGTTPEVSRGLVFDQDQIARAAELGIGITAPSQIQFVTGDEASQAYAARIEEFLFS